MKHPLRLLLAPCLVLFGACQSTSNSSRVSDPPSGFSALFNGQDLSGWWGAETEDPRKYMALDPEAFRKKHDDSLNDIRQHWRAEGNELVNDGKGLYLTT